MLTDKAAEMRDRMKDSAGSAMHGPPLPDDDFNGAPFMDVDNEVKKKYSREFRFVHAGELIKEIKPTEFVIEGVLEADALAALVGDPATYKSFLSLDWGLSVATGTPWNGHAVKQGAVFIIIGEGHSGYGKRIVAWQKSTGRYVRDAPFYISTAPVQMLDSRSAKIAGDAIDMLRDQHGKPAMVIFDTLARNFGPGDENSTKDMTRFVATLDHIIGNDTLRLLVHHSGHAEKQRGRGSSALKGALDAEYLLIRKDDIVTLKCLKMKDAETAVPMSFEPKIVMVGGDFQKPITSLYLEKIDGPATEAPKLSIQMNQALRLLDLMNRKSGISCLSDWMNICREEEVYTKHAFYNAANTMRDKRVVRISDGCVERY